MNRTSSTAWIINLNSADSIHLNFGYSRSWFQTPNSLDAAKRDAVEWTGWD